MLAQERRRIIGWLETLAGKPLQQKINIIQEHYPSVIFSESGIMYSLLKIDGETIRPLNESDFPYKGVRHDYGQWRHKPDGDWDLLNYENSITTSGLYLASQAWRYSATQEPDALDQAAKAFNSLDLICKLGEGDWRPGWMGKPYSGRISDQTSPDQYLDACLGMYHYHPHAPEKVRGRIEEMFVMFADYWQSVDYKLGYFGNAWDVKSSKGAYNLILLMINALAHRFSGRQEISRPSTTCTKPAPGSQRRKSTYGDAKDTKNTLPGNSTSTENSQPSLLRLFLIFCQTVLKKIWREP